MLVTSIFSFSYIVSTLPKAIFQKHKFCHLQMLSNRTSLPFLLFSKELKGLPILQQRSLNDPKIKIQTFPEADCLMFNVVLNITSVLSWWLIQYLLTITLHNILSKPPAAFPRNLKSYPNNESCYYDYNQSS